MSDVRPEVRRRYHEASWGAAGGQGRYEGATLDEYVALKRIEFPQATAGSAVRTAASDGRADLANATASNEIPVPPPDLTDSDFEALSEAHECLLVQKSGALDLDKAIGKKRPRVITCQRNTVSGWKALARGDRWLEMHFVQCKTTEKRLLAPVVPAGLLRVEMCDDATASLLAASVEATELSLCHGRPFDLSVAPGRRLETLAVNAKALSGVGTLGTRKLRVLILGALASFDEVRALVAANAGTLEVLELQVQAPFGPDQLPTLPRLRRLGVPSFEALRGAWIEFAATEAPFGVRFGPVVAGAAVGPAPAKAPAKKEKPAKASGRAKAAVDAFGSKWLDSWEGHVAPARIAAARALLDAAEAGLAALGAKATAAQR